MKSPRSSILLSLVCLLILPGCGNQSDSWQLFAPDGGGFRVMIPGEPQLETAKAADGSEPKSYKIFPAMSHIRGMAVSYADQPSGRPGGDRESILNKLRDGAIANLKGQLVNETHITLKGVPGRELKISLPKNYVVRMRLYLAGSRQYSLMIVAGASNYDSPEARKFFNSFEIIQ